MARAMAPKRKEPERKTEDVFVERLLEAATWVQHNVRTVIVGVVVISLVVAGIVYYLDYRSSLQSQAAVELQQITGSLGGVQTEEAATRLQEYISRYAGTQPAEEARLTLARLQLDLQRPAEALATLGPVTERPLDEPLGYGAAVLEAAAHEAQGDLEAASRVLASVADGARYGFQRRTADAERARLLVERGELAEAEEIYARLVTETEEASPSEAADYRVRLGEVRALRASGAANAPTASDPSETSG